MDPILKVIFGLPQGLSFKSLALSEAGKDIFPQEKIEASLSSLDYTSESQCYSCNPSISNPIFLVPFMLSIPQGLHSYVYCQNNPINFMDPIGYSNCHTKCHIACHLTCEIICELFVHFPPVCLALCAMTCIVTCDIICPPEPPNPNKDKNGCK